MMDRLVNFGRYSILKSFLFGAFFIVVNSFVGAEIVYKRTDENGSLIYSDRAEGDPEKMTVSAPNSVESLKAKIKSSAKFLKKEPTPSYKVRVRSPSQNHTFRNNEKISIEIKVSPPIRVSSGHKIEVFLNGSLHDPQKSPLSFEIADLDRGSHTINVSVKDISGEEISRSESRTFFVQKVSIIGRNRLRR